MSIFKYVANLMRFTAKVVDKVGRVIYTDKLSKNVKKWYNDPKNKLYKTDFNLNENSIVFDLGGFEGQWASDIYAKFNCIVNVFEPVKIYAHEIEERFKNNSKIKVYPFGLYSKNKKEQIAIQGEGSSILNKRDNSDKTEIELVRLVDFWKKEGIEKIDLMKINIEGAEFDLLEDIISEGLHENIENLLIQFHDFFPDAKQRMDNIRSKLKQTHNSKFYYEFVWEGWSKK